MSDENWGGFESDSSLMQQDLSGFNAIKKQILWTSCAQLLFGLISIAFVIWYVWVPESNFGEHIFFIIVLFAGLFVLGMIRLKFTNVKKRQFKEIVVREEISKKCKLQAYLHLPKELDEFPLAMITLAFNHPEYRYSMSDYIKGEYHGYPFRMIDLEWSLGNASGNTHLIAIDTKRRYEDGYLHLAPFARFFGNFQKVDRYAGTPFFAHEGIAKKIMACEAKKPNDYYSASAATDLTMGWEKT